MKRPVLAFALVLAAGSCSGKAPPPAAPSSDIAEEPGGAAATLPAGVADDALWSCAIEDYDVQPCKFHEEDDGWHLTKLLGSQRFTGAATFSAAGIQLVGEFFCPYGDCTETFDTTLAPEGNAYTGNVAGSPVRVWWDEANAAEYGGAGYGGRTGREMD